MRVELLLLVSFLMACYATYYTMRYKILKHMAIGDVAGDNNAVKILFRHKKLRGAKTEMNRTGELP